MVGPNFKGVKMVPPGAHFVSSNAVSSNTSASTGAGSDVAPTASFFVDVALRQVIIRRWDRLEELLLQLDDSDEVTHRFPQIRLVCLKQIVLHASSGCAGHAWHLLQQSIACALRSTVRPCIHASASCGPNLT